MNCASEVVSWYSQVRYKVQGKKGYFILKWNWTWWNHRAHCYGWFDEICVICRMSTRVGTCVYTRDILSWDLKRKDVWVVLFHGSL